MRKRIAKETWEQIKTAYFGGCGLREIARNMGIAPGTILTRARRENWTRQIQEARTLAIKPAEVPAVTPAEAIAGILAEDSRETKRSLSRATRRMAAQAEQAGLNQAGDALQCAKLATLLHGWTDREGKPMMTLNVIGSVSIEDVTEQGGGLQ